MFKLRRYNTVPGMLLKIALTAALLFNAVSFDGFSMPVEAQDAHLLQVRSIFNSISGEVESEHQDQFRVEAVVILSSILQKMPGIHEISHSDGIPTLQLPSLSELNARLDEWFWNLDQTAPYSERTRMLRVISEPRLRETAPGEYGVSVDVEIAGGKNKGKLYRINSTHRDINDLRSDEGRITVSPITHNEQRLSTIEEQLYFSFDDRGDINAWIDGNIPGYLEKGAEPAEISGSDLGETGINAEDTGTRSTFTVGGAQYYTSVVSGYVEMAEIIDRWFDEAGDEKRDFKKRQWMSAVSPDKDGTDVFLVCINDISGKIIGLGVSSAAPIPVVEDGSISGLSRGYLGKYFEISENYRNLGLGKLLIAKAVEEVMTSLRYPEEFERDDIDRIIFESVIMSKPVMILYPADQEAKKFFERGDVGFTPMVVREIPEREDDDPESFTVFHTLSWESAIALVEDVRALERRAVPGRLLTEPDPAENYKVARIGKKIDIIYFSLNEGPSGPVSIDVKFREEGKLILQTAVLHLTEDVFTLDKETIVDNSRYEKPLVRAMVDTFDGDVNVVFYEELYADMLGLVYPEKKMIAINRGLFHVRAMAVMHEIMEYLLLTGKMYLVFDSDLKQIEVEVKGKTFDPIDAGEVMDELRGEGEYWVDRESSWLNDPENRHYLLRILQRRIFGQLDSRLTLEVRRVMAKKGYEDLILPIMAMGKGFRDFDRLDEKVRDVLIWGGVGEKLAEFAASIGEENAEFFFEYGAGEIHKFGREFISTRWNEILRAGIQSEENVLKLFQEGFGDSIGIEAIKEHWDIIRKICRRAGKNAYYILRDGLPRFYDSRSGLLDDIYFSDNREKTREYMMKISDVLVSIAKNAGDDAGTFFDKGFETAFRISKTPGDIEKTLELLQKTSSEMSGMAVRAAGSKHVSEREYIYDGLKSLTDGFGEIFVAEHWNEIMKIYDDLGGEAASSVHFSLLALKKAIIDIFHGEKSGKNLVKIGTDLKKMKEASGEGAENTRLLLEKGLPGMAEIFEEEIIRQQWGTIVELAISSGDTSGYVLYKGIPLFADMLKKKDRPEDLRRDMLEIGKGLASFGKAAGEDKVYLYEALPLFRDMAEELDPAGYIRRMLVKLGGQLAVIVSSAGGSRGKLFNDLFQDMFEIFPREELYENWPELRGAILRICGNTTEYNRYNILTLILSREHLKTLKEKGADLIGHLDLCAAVIRENKNYSLNILGGLVEAVSMGEVPVNPDENEKRSILEFSGRMKSFTGLLYRLYMERGEEFLGFLSDFAEKIRDDSMGPDEIDGFLHNSIFEGYSWDSREEIMLSAIETRIPPSGSSSLKKDEILGQMRRVIRSGERRDDVPEALRNRDLGGGEKDAIPVVTRILKPDESIEFSEELTVLLDTRKDAESISGHKRTAEAGEDFLISLKEYSGSPDVEELRSNCERAFYSYVSNIGTVAAKIGAVKGTGYHDLILLEQLFNGELKDLLNEELGKVPRGELPRKSGRKTIPISDPEPLKVAIERIWGGNLDKGSKRDAVCRIFSGKNRDEIREKIINKVEDPELRDFLENTIDGMGHPDVMTHSEIRHEILGRALEEIRLARKKFIEFSEDDPSILEFRAVKGIPHGLWGLPTGVCVAEDMDLWENKDFFLLEMYDIRKRRVAGYAGLLSLEISGEKVLMV
ncbi:MAG: hypothetical protein WCV56_07590, partial [Candidatus Omnitrophota bacterium]